MNNQFDVIVIGAGGVGSAAAYYLSKAGKKVLLLEQFELNHQNGSSYGYSRVIRYTYDNPIYINLMRDAYPLWFALQEEAGEQLYVKTGGLDFGFPRQGDLPGPEAQHGYCRAGLRASG
jgi:glycine/D-amino acid oxidase-like deaminating enzyme